MDKTLKSDIKEETQSAGNEFDKLGKSIDNLALSTNEWIGDLLFVVNEYAFTTGVISFVIALIALRLYNSVFRVMTPFGERYILGEANIASSIFYFASMTGYLFCVLSGLIFSRNYIEMISICSLGALVSVSSVYWVAFFKSKRFEDINSGNLPRAIILSFTPIMVGVIYFTIFYSYYTSK